MDLIELDKALVEHSVLSKFKDGISDALLLGIKDDKQTHHYYKKGYDFGLTMYERVMENEKGADE